MGTTLYVRLRSLRSATATTTTTLWPALTTAAEARKRGRSPAADRLFGPGTALSDRAPLTSTARAGTTLAMACCLTPCLLPPSQVYWPARSTRPVGCSSDFARSLAGVHPL
ncbi:hypothetical protein MTO96_030725 [Rhipicephalus appendiculatus]